MRKNISFSGLDETDLAILRAVQSDARVPNARLAELVSLSETPCWRRLKRLEAEGFVREHVALLDREKIGFGVLAFAQVSFGDHAGEAPERFEQAVKAIPQILACHNTTGDFDYLLQIVATDLTAYGEFVRDVLRKLPGVTAIHSNLSLREVKATSALPLA